MRRTPRAVAAIASALLPGLGQILQRRYARGIAQLALLLAAYWWWKREGGFSLVPAIDTHRAQPPELPHLGWWVPLLAMLAVALWSVIDAARMKNPPR